MEKIFSIASFQAETTLATREPKWPESSMTGFDLV
jgi:hypothetical protein